MSAQSLRLEWGSRFEQTAEQVGWRVQHTPCTGTGKGLVPMGVLISAALPPIRNCLTKSLCGQHIVGSCFFNQSDNLCLLMGLFNQFTCNVIVAIAGFISAILHSVFFILYLSRSSTFPLPLYFILGEYFLV